MGDITEPTWTVGDRLKKARTHAGLNQAEMARRLGVRRSTVVRWEAATTIGHGSGGLTLAKLHHWAIETAVAADWIVGDAQRPSDLVERPTHR